jgi:type VI secretion system secreted protein VgrG
MAYTQTDAYLSISTPFGKDKLLLRGFYGEEGLSDTFQLNLWLQSETYDLDFSQIIGKSVTITAVLADGTKRYFSGVVGRFMQAGTEGGLANYHAELVPWLWLLNFSADCKIYQNMTVPQIILEVFKELGFTDYKNSLTGTYDAREYCVQYNETHFNFVSRLMEDEGIFYYFEHADGKHTLVLADDSVSATTCPGAATLDVASGKDQWEQQNTVTRCEIEQRVITGKFTLDDFNFETPSTDLIASVDSTKATDSAKANRRVYEYPGGYLVKDKGDARAKLRIEGHEAPFKLLRGDSNSPALTSGYKTTLAKHYRSDANGDYVLLRVTHSAQWDDYSNSFEALPADVPFRPLRTTRKPVIPSTQTALVVGQAGEEIWVDKYGRVKVQFHWDQKGKSNEESSCWIRVAHGWAGKGWGQIFIPRIGQEVVVSFLEGDPDRPLITGSVYNAEQTVPYALSDNGTKSTIKSNSSKGGSGFNEFRFEDKKDSEEVYFHAQKDHNLVIENNRTKEVKNDETNTIKNNRTTTIQEKNDTLTVAKGNRSVTVSEGNESLTVEKGTRTIAVNTGDETHTVKGKRTLSVTGDESHTNDAKFTHTVTGDYALTISGKLTIKVTGDISIKSDGGVTVEAGMALTNKAGTDLTNQAGTSLTNKSGTELSNKAGTNLTNEASITMTNKASASQTVDGGGMLTVKGGLVKIN